jgi:hypothetical protein
VAFAKSQKIEQMCKVVKSALNSLVGKKIVKVKKNSLALTKDGGNVARPKTEESPSK